MKNIFKKIGLSVMALVLGFTSANADEVASPMKLTIDPVKTIPGETVEIPVKYESSEEFVSFNMDITLPAGLSFVTDESNEDDEYIVLGDAVPKHTCATRFFEETNSLRIVVYSNKNAAIKEGTLFTFKVIADEKLADLSQISITKGVFADKNGGGIDGIKATVDVINMTKAMEENEAANEAYNATFTSLMNKLNDADATINNDCADVADEYNEMLAPIFGKANQIAMEIGELYAAIELTNDKADEAIAALKELEAQIQTIVDAAVEAQKNISTGINGVNANLQNAETVYSVGGVRMNKAAKGVNVVIRNGKAVKVLK